ncbi:MAG: ornithine cyclodeaminase [Proteobacteria bacterium]|nr:ornithine cyclodeaminase [Pseudomonadota bacterium]
MVDYIGVSDVQRIVQSIGIGTFIERLSRQIESDYRRWSDFEKSARLASHSPVGVIELMPTSNGRLYSFKYVNGHPKNTNEGLLTVTAFGALADVDTGYPLLLSELTITTALRTAATSALAARWLARPESRSMALIGNGAQSEFQAIAFRALLGIDELRLHDVDPAATAKLKQNLERCPEFEGVRLVVARSTAEACQGAEIVTTVTADKCNAVILTPPMIRPGMHLNAVGGDCPGKTELHPDVLRMPGARVIVEYEPQSRIEGEIQQMPADYPVTEFADLLAQHPRAGDSSNATTAGAGRRSASEITIFDSVGFALEDYSALCFLHELVQEQPEFGRKIDLVPRLDDPKDLFGGTLGAAGMKPRARLRAVG